MAFASVCVAHHHQLSENKLIRRLAFVQSISATWKRHFWAHSRHDTLRTEWMKRAQRRCRHSITHFLQLRTETMVFPSLEGAKRMSVSIQPFDMNCMLQRQFDARTKWCLRQSTFVMRKQQSHIVCNRQREKHFHISHIKNEKKTHKKSTKVVCIYNSWQTRAKTSVRSIFFATHSNRRVKRSEKSFPCHEMMTTRKNHWLRCQRLL